ncbi:MAG TPA: translocation/assembly module TamB domain-containing protein [Gemmatimonadales bacterium]|nr:translocation/assembly module TamB domain-containing protein [Gemmatimonadales bacterium]
MFRRSLGALLWTLVGILACFLGALSGLLETGAGRRLVSRAGAAAAARAVSGRIEVGDVGGDLITGLTLTDVRLFDLDTTIVAYLPRVDLSYNPFELAAGRIVLGRVDLTNPMVNLVQHPNGRLNIEDLLRLGGPPGKGPAKLILFRNVRVRDGSLTLRLNSRESPGDSALEIDTYGHEGRHRVRRFEHLNLRLAALRVSSPTDPGVRADVASLALQLDDPRVAISDLAGRIATAGDSLTLDLGLVALPHSRFSLKGRLSWPRDTVLYDLSIRADSATLADVRFIDQRFPAGAVLHHTDVLARSHGGRILEVQLDPLDLAYRGGRLDGRIRAVTAADSGLVALQDVDVTANNLDVGLATAFLDSLPVAGRLSGHTTADGPLSALALDLDWTFNDTTLTADPVSTVRGNGVVALGNGRGISFRPFTLAASHIDLGTARRFVPGLPLDGTIDAVGTVQGPTDDIRFKGALTHRDGNRPASGLSGALHFDARGDTLGVDADVTLDSLAWDGLKGSFPDLPLTGVVRGPVRLAGNLAALDVHAALVERDDGGAARVDGRFTLLGGRLAGDDVTVALHDLDLSRWWAGAGSSALNGTATGTVSADSGAAPTGALRATLGSSVVAGVPLDTGAARLRFADRRVYVDSLRVVQPGLVTTGLGVLGWKRDATGSLALDLDADSLGALDSLAVLLTGVSALSGGARGLQGEARAVVNLSGALDSLDADGDVSAERIRWGDVEIPGGRAHLSWRARAAAAFDARITLDSLAVGDLGFGAPIASLSGRSDSLSWFVRTRIGELGAVLGGGSYRRPAADSGRAATVGVDSLALLLPGGVWMLDRAASLRITDSLAAIDHLGLHASSGPGRLIVEGSLPRRGAAAAHIQLESFPLAGAYALLEQDTAAVGGYITAAVGLSGTRAAPVFTGSVALADVVLGEFHAPSLAGTFEYRDRRLDGGLELWRAGRQIMNVTAHLPVDLALEAVAHRLVGDTLWVRARADSVDLSVLEAATPNVRQVTGTFSADAGVRGTWDAPRLEGRAVIDRAGASIPSLAVRYADVNGAFRFSGDSILVDSITGRSDKGRAVVTGLVRLEQLTKPVLALSIRADQFKALEIKNYLSVTASGRLSLDGPVFGATLSGRGTVTSGVLYFADLVNKRVVNLDEPWVASLIDTSLVRRQRLGPEFQSVFLDSLRIRDLQLDMGSDVWLRSNEANIQLTGTVAVGKRADQYQMSGTLQALRGQYRLQVGPATREFIVTQGTVRYFGTPDLNADLDIEATHVVHPVSASGSPSTAGGEDVTVVARIGGTLLAPQLHLSALNQDLSQTEIISYLLFGQGTFELSGDQSAFADKNAMVKSAVAGIVSREVERSLVSDLGVPLDYVEIRPGDPADPLSGLRFTAGWQIGRKTFLLVNAGLCQSRQTTVTNALGASLQFRFNDQWRTEASFEPVRTCSDITVQSNIVPPRQVGLDLFWERRY